MVSVWRFTVLNNVETLVIVMTILFIILKLFMEKVNELTLKKLFKCFTLNLLQIANKFSL